MPNLIDNWKYVDDTTTGEQQIVQQRGRILYVDPNDVNSFVDSDSKKTNLTPPYEDLCISYNLIIEKYSRFDAQKRTEIGLIWTDTLSKDKDSTHFSVLDGTLKTRDNKKWVPEYGEDGNLLFNYDKSYLTTYYTEISADGYKKSEQIEGLGVTSIQVNYDSYYVPTVTITFVDVRGSALFGREEAIHSNANGDGQINAENIFGAFFTMPYPKFRLQIKGFYGKDVTYQLTVSNFKANFNAQTGNIEATASFIGYTWSLLTDVPLSYLVAAPHCKFIGAEYWNTMCNSKEWEMDNNPKSGCTQLQPPKLNDLFNTIKNCQAEFDQIDAVATNGEEKRTLLNSILEKVNRYNDMVSFTNGGTSTENGDGNELYNEIRNDIITYNSMYTPDIIDESNITNGNGFMEISSNSPNYFVESIKNSYNNYVTQSQNTSKNTLYFKDEFIKELEDKIAKCDEEIQVEITNKKNEFLKNSLQSIGIDPNIKNIFKILMCHLETLLQILFEGNRQVEAQKQQGLRTAEQLGINIPLTDLPERYDSDRTIQLPYWTAVFGEEGETDEDNNNDGMQYDKIYKWVGSLEGSTKWIEEDIVRSLKDAVFATNKSTEINKGVAESKRIKNILILPSDITLSNETFANVMDSNIDDICGFLGIRAAQVLGITFYSVSPDSVLPSLLGELDAYNYFISCGSRDEIKSAILDKYGSVDNILNTLTCDFDDFAISKNNDGNYYHSFEREPHHLLSKNENKSGRHCMYSKINTSNGIIYKYIYFYDKNSVGIIPSRIERFGDYGKYISLKTDGNEIYYEGKVKDGVAQEWIVSSKNSILTESTIINKDMFNIVDDATQIAQIEEWYTKIKNGSFEIGDYTVAEAADHFEKIDYFFKVDFENYASSFNNIQCLFLGASYANNFDTDHPKPEKNKWITDTDLYKRSLVSDNISINSSYTIGDSYDELKDPNGKVISINELYFKSLPVWDSNGNSAGTLFTHPLYYNQNQIDDVHTRLKAQCFLFLQSLPKRKQTTLFKDTFGNTVLRNKLLILYIGGLLWRQEYVDEDGKWADPIVYNNPSYYKCYNAQKKEVYTIGNEVGLLIDSKGSKCLTIKEIIGVDYKTELDNNTKLQLIQYFENFAIKTFSKIDARCQLKNPSTFQKYTNGNEFLNYAKSNFSNTTVQTEGTVTSNEYAFFYAPTKNNQFQNKVYSVFDEGTSTEIQEIIRDVLFGKVILLIETGKTTFSDGNVKIFEGSFKAYLNAFINTLQKIYDSQTDDINNTQITDTQRDIDKNLLINLYVFCKNIWEKWLLPLSAEDTEKGAKYFNVENWFNSNFVFIDSYYNDISNKLKINLDSLSKSYEGRSREGSLFSFIGDIVSDHRCLFVGLPDYVDLGLGIKGEHTNRSIENMKEMFKPMPFSKINEPRMDNHFVVIYTYPPASQMPEEYSHRFDGFDIYSTDNDKKNPFFKTANINEQYEDDGVTKYGYNVPSFGIAFSKQNNHLFKNFNISMDNPIETEQSIKTLVNIAGMGAEKSRRICFYGQDIYNIFNNYSYQIEVEMMGNAQIQPLMYFQLLNIPMWRGAYMIFNVSHILTPGNMVTKFKAMKMSKNAVPLLSKYWEEMENVDYGGSGDYIYRGGEVVGLDNNLPDKVSAPKKDYLKEHNINPDEITNIDQSIRTLFNQLYEEITMLDENKNGVRWNIVATSGYRSKSCDHSKNATLDIHIQRYDNGIPGMIQVSGTKQPELCKVIHLIRKNHMGQISNGRCALEYPSPTAYLTDNESFSMIHFGTKTCNGGSGFCLWRVDSGPFYGRSMMDYITIEQYLSQIPPYIKKLAAIDFKNESFSKFTSIWNLFGRGKFTQEKLHEYFSTVEFTEATAGANNINVSEAFDKWFEWSRTWEGETNGIVGSTNTDINFQRTFALTKFWNKYKLDKLNDPFVAIISMFVVYWTGNPSFIIRVLKNEPFEYGKWGYAQITDQQIEQMNASNGKTLFNKIKKMCGNYVLHPWGASLKSDEDFRPGWRRRWTSITYGSLQPNNLTKKKVSEEEIKNIMSQL